MSNNETTIEARPVPGYSRLRATSAGTIESQNQTGEWRPLKPRLDRYGYARVNLYEAGEHRTRSVHSLVAAAWHGERPPDAQVRHLSGLKTDNRPVNLAYGTAADQVDDDARNGKTKLNPSAVRLIRELHADPERRWSTRGLAAAFRVAESTVYNVLAGRRWSHVPR